MAAASSDVGGAAPATRTGAEWPRIFAHRGGAGEAPENTLLAFLAAHRLDASVVLELDVHASRDGHLVVIHDATVDRTTNGTGRVRELTLAQLKALDAGHCATPGRGNGTADGATCRAAGPFPFRGKGVTIPTLRELLEALPAHVDLSIELKTAGHERQLADLLRPTIARRSVFLGSHDDRVAEALGRVLPEALLYFPTAAAAACVRSSTGPGARACAELFDRYDVLAAPTWALGLDLSAPAILGPLRARGVPVVYFTINDADEMDRLFRAGASGVFTDYPSRARRVLDRLRSPGNASPNDSRAR